MARVGEQRFGTESAVQGGEFGVAFLDDEGAEGEAEGYVIEGVGF